LHLLMFSQCSLNNLSILLAASLYAVISMMQTQD
jgi:hypothetical protein